MKSISVLFVSLLLALLPLHADSFHLKDGDRVVFYGDSITDQRLYTTFTETYVVTRFPEKKIWFTHSGWGGDRVGGGGGGPIDLRLSRDVLAYKPTVMTIMLGMNDASYRPFDENIFAAYSKGYEHIIRRMKQDIPGIRITVIQPSPFDDVTRPPSIGTEGYNSVLLKYGAFVQQLAQREKLNFADLNTSVVEATRKAHAANPNLAPELNKDRVHPGPGGQLLMAAALLKAWGAPSVVSAVTIDAGSKKAVQNENCSISKLSVGDSITWEQKDKALPLPINLKDAVIKLAVDSSDVMQSLNQQTLRVTGLKSGTYLLKIDDSAIGRFGADELGKGINLATQLTPMMKQAADVHNKTLEHNNIHFARWRQIQVPMAAYKDPGVDKATEQLMAALDAKEKEVVDEQRKLAQPKTYRFELVSAP